MFATGELDNFLWGGECAQMRKEEDYFEAATGLQGAVGIWGGISRAEKVERLSNN